MKKCTKKEENRFFCPILYIEGDFEGVIYIWNLYFDQFVIYINKYRYVIVFVAILLLFIGLFIPKENKNSISVLSSEVLVDVEEEIINKKIMVDIKGAVVNPGVYELDDNSRVNDIILKSGGLLENADTSFINLSKELSNEMVVIIYTKDEISEMLEGDTSIKVVYKECICPDLGNDACVDVNNFESNVNSNGFITEDVSSLKVSINSASLSMLMTLTGIGESKALAIIDYRNIKGGFNSLEELMNVSGIGQSTYDKIKDNISL